MIQAYPTFICKEKKDYLVYVPDMDIYTEGKSLENAIEMARDAIGLKGIDMEEDQKVIPKASDYNKAIQVAKQDATDFDYTEGTLTLVNVDFSEYRKQVDNRSVRRNVTIPNWLNTAAEKEHLNVSKVLQDALMNQLGLMKK